MKKRRKQIFILIFLFILCIIAFFLYLYRESRIINEKNILGSFVYKVQCDKDTVKGENGFSITTLTLNKNNTFIFEFDDCFSFNILEGEFSFDKKTKSLLLQNSVAEYVRIFNIENVDTIIEVDELDRKLIYERKK